MKIKKISLTLIHLFTILFISTVLGILFLVLAYSIPVNPETKESTFKFSDAIGWSPKASLRYEQYISHFDTFEPDVLDDGTDKIILSNTFDESDTPLLKKSVAMFGYGRYWHGYVSLLRPIFYYVDYWDFFLLNGLLQIFIVFIFGILIWKKTLMLRYSLAAITSYLLLMPITLTLSLQYTAVFYIAFLGSLIIISGNAFLYQKNRIYLFFAILGILTCYFDFLTYPLLTWAFPLCWYLIIQDKLLTISKKYITAILSAFTWIFGYVGLFFTKWVLVYIICGAKAFDESNPEKALSYLKVVPDHLKVSKHTYNRFDTIYTNWRHYMFAGFAIIILLWLLWALISRLKYNWRIQAHSLPFWLIIFSGPAWCLVFTGHTTIHHFFTYRILAASILAFILFLCRNVPAPAALPKERSHLKIWALLPLSLVIGWVLTSYAKENVVSIYGIEYQPLRLTPGEQFECSFYPSFDDIRQFGLCAAPVNELDGAIDITLQDKTITYKTSFPIKDFRDQTYKANYVVWKNLKPGTEYHMSLSVRGNKSGVDLFVTYNGNMPLYEYKNSRLNGNILNEIQLLGSIVYNTTVRSKSSRIYLTFLTGFYLWMFGESLLCCWQQLRSTYHTVVGTDHGECNVHLLRYLKKNTEETGNEWSFKMTELFRRMNRERKELIKAGISSFHAATIGSFEREYAGLIEKGRKENKTTAHQYAKEDEKTLLNRLEKYSCNHLLFLHNFSVPFDDNISERDLRKAKNRQKMAGGFRKDSGHEMYCNILTIIETLKKRKMGTIENIKKLFMGTPAIF